jgi:hypothetical protein
MALKAAVAWNESALPKANLAELAITFPPYRARPLEML